MADHINNGELGLIVRNKLNAWANELNANTADITTIEGDYVALDAAVTGLGATVTGLDGRVTALETETPESLRDRADVYSEAEVDALIADSGVALTNRPIPAGYFAMHYKKLPSDAGGTTWPNIGVKRVRFWDCGLTWRKQETAPGVWDLARLIAWRNQADSKDFDILMVLGQPPIFHTGGVATGLGVSSTDYNASPPVTDASWVAYCTQIANTLKVPGKVRYYSPWNEINLTGFYTGSVARMIQLIILMVNTISAIDPEAKFLLPSVTTSTGAVMLDEILATPGIGSYFDIVAIHLYPISVAVDDVIDRAKSFQSIVAKHNFEDREIWNDEYTVFKFVDDDITLGWPNPLAVLPNRRASSYLIQLLAFPWCFGISSNFFYGYDQPFSSIRMVDMAAPATQYAPAHIYQFMANLMVGATLIDSVFTSDGLRMMTITKAGVTTLIACAAEGTNPTFSPQEMGITSMLSPDDTGELVEIDYEGFAFTLSDAVICTLGNNKNSRQSVGSAANSVTRWPIISNSDFSDKIAGVPVDWQFSAAVAPYSGPGFGKHAIIVTPASIYKQIRTVLSRPLEPGLYEIVVNYQTAGKDWYIALETPNGNGVMPETYQHLVPIDYKKQLRFPVNITDDYPSKIKLALSWSSGTYFEPIMLDYFAIEKVSGAPAQHEPYNRKISYTTLAAPTSGNFTKNDLVLFSTHDRMASMSAIGLVCATDGTAGSLVGVTVNTIAGNRNVVVSVADSLTVGNYVAIGGDLPNVLVITKNGPNQYVLDTAPLVTNAAAPITFAVPTFKSFGPLRGSGVFPMPGFTTIDFVNFGDAVDFDIGFSTGGSINIRPNVSQQSDTNFVRADGSRAYTLRYSEADGFFSMIRRDGLGAFIDATFTVHGTTGVVTWAGPQHYANANITFDLGFVTWGSINIRPTPAQQADENFTRADGSNAYTLRYNQADGSFSLIRRNAVGVFIENVWTVNGVTGTITWEGLHVFNDSFTFYPLATAVVGANGEAAFEMPSNTKFRVRAKGLDGIVRTGEIPLVATGPARQLAQNCQASVALNNPGHTNQTALAVVPLPAGLLSPNDILYVHAIFTMTSSGNLKTPRIQICDLGGTFVGPAFFDPGINTVGVIELQVECFIHIRSLISQFSRNKANTNDVGTSTGTLSFGAANLANAKELVISGQLGVGTETFTLEAYAVELLRAPT